MNHINLPKGILTTQFSSDCPELKRRDREQEEREIRSRAEQDRLEQIDDILRADRFALSKHMQSVVIKEIEADKKLAEAARHNQAAVIRAAKLSRDEAAFAIK